jgi:gamma-glutamyltranspeptidase/glutathione hydrolase
MNGRDAVTAGRSHHQWLPDNVTIEGATPQLIAALKALGHDARSTNRQGSAQTIWIDPKSGTPHGIADTRDSTAKASKADR